MHYEQPEICALIHSWSAWGEASRATRGDLKIARTAPERTEAAGESRAAIGAGACESPRRGANASKAWNAHSWTCGSGSLITPPSAIDQSSWILRQRLYVGRRIGAVDCGQRARGLRANAPHRMSERIGHSCDDGLDGAGRVAIAAWI